MGTLMEEVVDGYVRGWSFTPLSGKIPTSEGWQEAPRADLKQVMSWAKSGNVGVRTGQASGFAVIDCDQEECSLTLPKTVTAITGGGGRHFYFKVDDRLVKNSTKKIDQFTDVKGDGGQVVFVGSIHPKTGKQYVWAPGLSPVDIEMAPMPYEVLDLDWKRTKALELRNSGKTFREIAEIIQVSPQMVAKYVDPPVRQPNKSSVDKTAPTDSKPVGANQPANAPTDSSDGNAVGANHPFPSSTKNSSTRQPLTKAPSSVQKREKSYSLSALEHERQAVASAPEGQRNATLNTAAFNLGQLVGGGLLPRAVVESTLAMAAHEAGLTEPEITKTISSGIDSGIQKPRTIPPPPPAAPAAVATHGGADGELILDPNNPTHAAREFRTRLFSHADCSTLYYVDETFFHWDGCHYVEIKPSNLRSQMYAFLESAQKKVKVDGEFILKDYRPTKANVDWVVDALKADTFLSITPPAWIGGKSEDLPPADEIIVARNGLIQMSHPDPIPLRRPTPMFFTRNAVDYDFDPKAPEPVTWLRFLDSLWPDDVESIELLQMWMGYCLTSDTSQQKILMMVGATRCGKGTIMRTMERMVGKANCCNPSLSGMAGNFGLAPLQGKLLGTITDARISGRTDQAVVVERLLSISGEDSITIDRKFKEPITEKLPTRLMIMTNELPKLGDVSGALANRFMILHFPISFLGREDTKLGARLFKELPSILLWSIKGWRKLQELGRFRMPQSSHDVAKEMLELSSPIHTFIDENCRLDPNAFVAKGDLFEAWRDWCAEHGHKTSADHVFGRDLRAAIPGISELRLRMKDDDRPRCYGGIDLTESSKLQLSVNRGQRQAKLNKQMGVSASGTSTEPEYIP